MFKSWWPPKQSEVELDQILLDVLTLAAVPPYPWGQLIYHDVLLQKLNSGQLKLWDDPSFGVKSKKQTSKWKCVKVLGNPGIFCFPMPGLQGNFAEFGVGLGGSSLFFGQMAARWGRKMLAVATWMPTWEGHHPHDTLHIHTPRSN